MKGLKVTSIASHAFNGSQITEASVPEGVKAVGNNVFEWCPSLTKVVFPEGLEVLGYDVFWSCYSLKAVNLPSTLVSVGDGIVAGCHELDSVSIAPDHPYLKLEDGVLFTKAEPRLLWYPAAAGERDYRIPEGTISIADYAFSDARVTSVEIPESVSSVGSYVFSECTQLRSVNIPSQVTVLDSAFSGCNSLTDILVSPENPVFESWDGVLFNRSERKLVLYPEGKNNDIYEIPQGTLAIEGEAFNNAVFSQVVIPGSVRVFGGNAFFNCKNLETITIPEGVEELGESALQACKKLTEIHLPNSLVKVGWNPFLTCENLENVTVDPTHSALAVMDGALVSSADMRLIWYPLKGKAKKYTVPAGIKVIEVLAFDSCIRLTEVVLPKGIEEIRQCAFQGCTKLKRVVLPASLTMIDKNAFQISPADGKMIKATYEVVKGSYAENYCKSFKAKIKNVK